MKRMPYRLAVLSVLVIIVVLGALAVSIIDNAAEAQGPLPPEKQALENRIEQFRQEALKAPRPAKNPTTGRPIPNREPEPAWPTGIIENGQAPFPSEMYVFENQYQQLVGKNYVNVYAGALGNDATQGVLVMQSSPDLMSGRNVSIYLTPTKMGSLRIVQADGLMLRVQAANGNLFIFDMARGTLSQSK